MQNLCPGYVHTEHDHPNPLPLQHSSGLQVSILQLRDMGGHSCYVCCSIILQHIVIDGEPFVNGSMVFNNPVEQVLQEAELMFPH